MGGKRNARLLTCALLLSLGAPAGLSCGRGSAATVEGGTSDADASGPTLPGCLRDLFALCPQTGECRTMQNDGGSSWVSCFNSGVRADHSSYPNTSLLCNGRFERKVFRADGQLCYVYESREVSPQTICGESHTGTWRDAMGQLIASQSEGIRSTTVTCTAGGETLHCDPTCPPNLLSASCPAGSCP